MQVIAHQGDTVDAICHRHYGFTAGITEAVFAANPGLAEFGAILPHGAKVELPQATPPKPVSGLINLWD
ncbi:tail protein X [Craterilacuibacter sp. RT1T]|uniref:tail protein X n=1 Tax=Craterilacuibacter sp. RT1T TaxID=2942211 RepID=UPI0020BF4317|nr:tail protein X [Craterilacuibacter sp. RT1T]MCL6262187.1 tail protein X [Craterilacuibacter sp. RT1T]